MPDSQIHASRFAALEGAQFDVVIIGGGIIGAGLARDAALRGLRVALFEKRDFGSGTTAGSTRLIHGGLRYLEMLDFRLVRMDLRERETLLRIAPHLVHPLEFVMPFYRNSFSYRGKMKLGMMLYDLLSYDKSLPRHRFLSPSELKKLEPHLSQKDLQGAALYFDAQADSPERLCIENIIDAAEHGAQTFNYAEVTGALRTSDAIDGVRVRDLLNDDGREVAVKSRIVINASGAWFDRVASGLTDARATPAQIRTTKGAHITCPPVTNRAVVFFSPLDGRLMFVIPWLGYSWVGTTDTDFAGDPATAQTTAEDVDYMLRSVTEYFPTLDAKRIYFSNAGVRALVKEEGSESSVSRMHRIADGARSGAKNLISVLGGKITGYRQIAEEAIDIVCAKLKVNAPCLTARNPLPGARGKIKPSNVSDAGLKKETIAHLFDLYGSRAREVINLAASNECLREPLSPHAPDIAAQVVFAARTEQCRRLVDLILRRTLLGFSQDQGQSAAERVASLLAQELDWSSARTAIEMSLYQDYIATTQAFRDDGATAEKNAANNQRAVIECANKTVGAEA
ncbi:MAG: glycerol-3-phosphate dehydrogenase/oxidase [Pyrinomonadaceae bacterium]